MFGLKSFKGGIHPPDKKDISRDCPIKEMPLTAEMILPLSQHAGSCAEPLVKKGDRVLKGQVIGEKDGFITASVHASTSGEVTDVKPCTHPYGNKVLSVFIKPDGEDKRVPLENIKSLDEISPQGIIKRIKDAGLVGLGGAAFPTHVKLSPPEGKKADVLLVNAVECEPYLTADYRVMLEESDKVISGIRVFSKALGVDRAYLAIESNKPKAVELFSRFLEKDELIKVGVVKTKYPQGSEKQLIESLTGRRVQEGKLPIDAGVVVQNVATAKAAFDAVFEGKALVERVLCVTGSNIRNPANLRVRLGTKISDIIDFCGGCFEAPLKVIQGGPMMGIAAPSLDVPVIKGTSGILLLRRKEIVFNQPGPCIRCGRCRTACPMGLMPERFMDLAQAQDYSQALADKILSCMECGSCAYSCPARRPLVHWIKIAKSQINKQLKKNK